MKQGMASRAKAPLKGTAAISLLAAIVAEISQQEVIRKMQEAKNDEAKTPREILLLIRQQETIKNLLYSLAK